MSRVLYMQYASAFLLICRSIWRIVETFQGPLGYLVRSEILFYIFEGVFMLANAILWGRRQSGPGPAQGERSLPGERWGHAAAWAGLVVSEAEDQEVLDPFDLAGSGLGGRGMISSGRGMASRRMGDSWGVGMEVYHRSGRRDIQLG